MHPRRVLGLWRLVGVTFFCVAGGPYGLEDAVGAVGPAFALVAVLVVPWLWALPTALLTAELSSAMPEDGGYVVWVERAFGRFWGFQEGWWSWVCSFADNALYPVLFVEYLKFFWPGIGAAEYAAVALALVALFAWLNVRGTRLAGTAALAFTVVVLAPFAAVVALGLPSIDTAAWLARPAAAPSAGAWSALVSVALWNYCGWDNAGCVAGEVEEPERTYPRAMVATVLLVTGVYLLPLAVGVSASRDWAAWSDGHFSEVGRAVGGAALGVAITAGGLVAASGLLSTLLLTSARVPYAMAARGTLPRALARTHARYGTPHVAVLTNAVGCAALVLWAVHAGHERGPFVALVEIDMWLYAAALVLEFAALVWLRLRAPGMPRPYRIRLGVPGLVAFSLPPVALCFLSMALCPRPTQLLGAGAIVVGWGVYQIATRAGGSAAPSRTGGVPRHRVGRG